MRKYGHSFVNAAVLLAAHTISSVVYVCGMLLNVTLDAELASVVLVINTGTLLNVWI